jgi:hypothetical protein
VRGVRSHATSGHRVQVRRAAAVLDSVRIERSPCKPAWRLRTCNRECALAVPATLAIWRDRRRGTTIGSFRAIKERSFAPAVVAGSLLVMEGCVEFRVDADTFGETHCRRRCDTACKAAPIGSQKSEVRSLMQASSRRASGCAEIHADATPWGAASSYAVYDEPAPSSSAGVRGDRSASPALAAGVDRSKRVSSVPRDLPPGGRVCARSSSCPVRREGSHRAPGEGRRRGHARWGRTALSHRQPRRAATPAARTRLRFPGIAPVIHQISVNRSALDPGPVRA